MQLRKGPEATDVGDPAAAIDPMGGDATRWIKTGAQKRWVEWR